MITIEEAGKAMKTGEVVLLGREPVTLERVFCDMRGIWLVWARSVRDPFIGSEHPLGVIHRMTNPLPKSAFMKEVS